MIVLTCVPLPTSTNDRPPSYFTPPPQANRQFDKERVVKEVAEVVKAAPGSYNKDDFFDTMSCEALDKGGRTVGSFGVGTC